MNNRILNNEDGAIMTKPADASTRKILLTGVVTDSCNKGCRALASSVVGLLAGYNTEIICVTSQHPENQSRQVTSCNQIRPMSYLRYRRLPHKLDAAISIPVQLCMAWAYERLPIRAVRMMILNRSEFIRALTEAHFVGDIREGDSFSDIYGLKRLLIGSTPALAAILLKKDLVLLPQTYGPYRSCIAKLMARFILRHAKRIYARCGQGPDEVKAVSGCVTAEFCPDVAFMLEPRLPNPLVILPAFERSDITLLVGLNLSGLLYHGCYTKRLSFNIKLDYKAWVNSLIELLVKDHCAHVLLVPHVFGSGIDDDLELCRTVWNSARARHGDCIHFAEKDYSESEIKGVIGLCDFFIGSRMHACIAAISQGIPAVGVAYSNKFEGVFDSVGIGDHVLDARKLTGAEALDFCIDRLRHRKEVRSMLKSNVENAKDLIEKTFREIREID